MTRSIALARLALCGAVISLPMLLAEAARAQAPPGIDPGALAERFQNPEAMQKLAEEAEAAQRCLAGIDQGEMDAIQKKAEAASREIDALCADGKKDEALGRALALGKEMNANPTVAKLRACSKGMLDQMRDMPWAQPEFSGEGEPPSSDDLCSR